MSKTSDRSDPPIIDATAAPTVPFGARQELNLPPEPEGQGIPRIPRPFPQTGGPHQWAGAGMPPAGGTFGHAGRGPSAMAPEPVSPTPVAGLDRVQLPPGARFGETVEGTDLLVGREPKPVLGAALTTDTAPYGSARVGREPDAVADRPTAARAVPGTTSPRWTEPERAVLLAVVTGDDPLTAESLLAEFAKQTGVTRAPGGVLTELLKIAQDRSLNLAEDLLRDLRKLARAAAVQHRQPSGTASAETGARQPNRGWLGWEDELLIASLRVNGTGTALLGAMAEGKSARNAGGVATRLRNLILAGVLKGRDVELARALLPDLDKASRLDVLARKALVAQSAAITTGGLPPAAPGALDHEEALRDDAFSPVRDHAVDLAALDATAAREESAHELQPPPVTLEPGGVVSIAVTQPPPAMGTWEDLEPPATATVRLAPPSGDRWRVDRVNEVLDLLDHGVLSETQALQAVRRAMGLTPPPPPARGPDAPDLG